MTETKSEQPYDPTEHTVPQVDEYLQKALANEDFAEIRRVVEAERAQANPRSTLLDDWDDVGVDPDVPHGGGAVSADAATNEPPASPTGDATQATTGVDDDAGAEQVDVRPVWRRETHGKPPPGKESLYRVV